MLAIRGIYTGKEIKPLEDIHVRPNVRVIITFLEDEVEKGQQQRIPGSAKGMISIADDFEAPLDSELVKEFYK